MDGRIWKLRLSCFVVIFLILNSGNLLCLMNLPVVPKSFNGNSSKFTEVPTNIPIDVTIVYLASNLIQHLPNGVFENLSVCISLNLYDNWIKQIDGGAFVGLNNLETLNLNRNKIVHIRTGTFTGLDNLKSLLLFNNDIRGFWK